MSKVQNVGGKHMTSHQCVTSFRHKAAILFSEYARNFCATTVFNKLCVWKGYLKEESLLRAENAYGDKEIKKKAIYK